MSGLKVSPDQLNALSGSVSRISTQVRGEHAGLRNQLSPLFGADWSGTAASQFTALYDQFDKNARGMSDALDGIATLLAKAGADYTAAESQIASSFR